MTAAWLIWKVDLAYDQKVNPGLVLELNQVFLAFGRIMDGQIVTCFCRDMTGLGIQRLSFG